VQANKPRYKPYQRLRKYIITQVVGREMMKKTKWLQVSEENRPTFLKAVGTV